VPRRSSRCLALMQTLMGRASAFLSTEGDCCFCVTIRTEAPRLFGLGLAPIPTMVYSRARFSRDYLDVHDGTEKTITTDDVLKQLNFDRSRDPFRDDRPQLHQAEDPLTYSSVLPLSQTVHPPSFNPPCHHEVLSCRLRRPRHFRRCLLPGTKPAGASRMRTCWDVERSRLPFAAAVVASAPFLTG
jgi:hypothetical protein